MNYELYRHKIRYTYFFIIFIYKLKNNTINGDWGLGIGDWGLGPIPNPQSPIPQSPRFNK